MKGNTFFGVLIRAEKLLETQNCDEESYSLFSQVVSYVEACSFSNSEATKFICKNWRLSSSELSERWSVSHPAKSVNTFRSQLSTTNRQLFGLFGNIVPEVFYKKSLLSEEDKVLRRNLVNALAALDYDEDIFVPDIFISEVGNFFEDASYDTYKVEDCMEELRLIKILMKSNVFSYIEKINADKLKFILGVLNQPISSNRSRSINHNKIAILNQLHLLPSSFVGLQKNSASEESSQVVERVVERQVPEKHRFTFAFNKEMADILEERLAQPTTEAEMKAWSDWEKENKDHAYIVTVLNTLYCMTADGFKKFLSRVNIIALSSIVNGTFGDVKGRDYDFTDKSQSEKAFVKYQKEG